MKPETKVVLDFVQQLIMDDRSKALQIVNWIETALEENPEALLLNSRIITDGIANLQKSTELLLKVVSIMQKSDLADKGMDQEEREGLLIGLRTMIDESKQEVIEQGDKLKQLKAEARRELLLESTDVKDSRT
jgi:hypothetical protein